MKFNYILLGFLLMTTACKPSFDNTEVQKLYDEVMLIHDDVMPKMGDIHKTKKQLKAQLSSQIESVDTSRAQVLMAIKKLEVADDMMMDWMGDFKGDFKGASTEETLAYFRGQKDIITQVSKEMLQAIENGQKLIQ